METSDKAIVPFGDVLSPWEKKFCEWMVEKYPSSVKKTDSAKACSAYAGREVTIKELNTLRQRRAYRRYYTSLVAQNKEKLDEARVIMNEGLPKAAQLHVRAIDEMLTAKDKDGKLLAVDIRAVPAITAPFLERVWPKKTESEHRELVITVNLTGNQVAGLNEPIMDVEFEEVTTEIVP